MLTLLFRNSEMLFMTQTLCVNLIFSPTAIIQSWGQWPNNIYKVSMMQFACKQHLLVLIGIYRVQQTAILNKAVLFLYIRSLSPKPQCEQFQNKMWWRRKKWFCHIYKSKLSFCENEEKLCSMFFNKAKINRVNII